MKEIFKHIQSYLLQNKIEEKRGICIGLSGGPDSIFLTEALLQFFPSRNFRAFHINHSLREEADLDVEFIRKYCAEKGICFDSVKINVSENSKKHKISFELAGRRIRYEEFNKYAKANNLKYIATAHTADDLVETFLFRLMRGTGADGLESIPEYSEFSGNFLIRPLLGIYKNEILDYLHNNKIEYIVDSTNFSTEYSRNKIRLELLPYIEKNFNPKFKENIVNLIHILKSNNFFAGNCAENFYNYSFVFSTEKNQAVINSKAFSEVPEYIQTLIIKKILSFFINENKAGDFLPGIEYAHIEYIREFIKKSRSGKRISIPYNLNFSREFDKVIISNNLPSCANGKIDNPINVNISDVEREKSFKTGKFKITINKLSPSETAQINSDELSEYEFIFLYDFPEKLKFSDLIFRIPINQDKIKPRDFPGRKTMKKIFQEKKIGTAARKKYVCVEYGHNVLFAPELVKCENVFYAEGSGSAGLKIIFHQDI